MTKQELLELVDSTVYENDNHEITGEGLNNLLKKMIEFNGEGCDYVLDLTNVSEEWYNTTSESPATKAEAANLLGITEEQIDNLFAFKVIYCILLESDSSVGNAPHKYGSIVGLTHYLELNIFIAECNMSTIYKDGDKYYCRDISSGNE